MEVYRKHDLAVLLEVRRDYEEAALAYRNRALGLVDREQGRPALARRHLEAALQIYRQGLGSDHSEAQAVSDLLAEFEDQPAS